jgi:DNA-binding transcriptional MocR family regulator
MTIWLPEIAARSGPRYRAIADCLAEDVRDRRLQPGDQLPPQRDLADRLGVTVGTVSRAYAEAEKRGLVRGEVGRGTFVRDPSARDDPLLQPKPAGGAVIDLGLNLPLYALDPDLGAALAALAKRADVNALLRYQPQRGSARHRSAGAAWIGQHGLTIDPGRVVITAGAQHAIAVALGTLCRAGDTVLTEPLTYPGVKTVASLLGLRLAAVAMDGEGMLPEALAAAATNRRARVVYCLPTLHNPTAAIMSRRRREELVAVARAHDLLLVEDDVHGLLEPDAPTPVAALAPERTYYVASTSKLLAGGLRVAYVVAPPDAVERMEFAVAASLWVAPPLNAELAAIWIEDGTAERVVGSKRREAATRQQLARSILPAARLRPENSSYFVWLELPPPWTTERFVTDARSRGVVVMPATAFAVGSEPAPQAVRISLSCPLEHDELEAGLRILADILARDPAPDPAIV